MQVFSMAGADPKSSTSSNMLSMAHGGCTVDMDMAHGGLRPTDSPMPCTCMQASASLPLNSAHIYVQAVLPVELIGEHHSKSLMHESMVLHSSRPRSSICSLLACALCCCHPAVEPCKTAEPFSQRPLLTCPQPGTTTWYYQWQYHLQPC